MIKNRKRVKLMLISGLDYPNNSRPYLMRLVKEIAEYEDVGFIGVVGHILAGKHLELLLKNRIAEALEGVKPRDREDKRQEVADEFVWEIAHGLDEFLPKINGDVNYHTVLAEKVYDRPIGARVMEQLVRMRGDVRVSDDPETKYTIQIPGFGDMRLIVPRKSLWFYENITGPAQRIVNGFTSRTLSPKARLIGVGGTGNCAFMPNYHGTGVIVIPTCHKIDEQMSNENMVGAVVVEIVQVNGDFRIIPKFYDFRTAVFNEKAVAFPRNLKGSQRCVLEALKAGSASLTTTKFRINHPQGKDERSWSNEKTERNLKELVKRKLVTYNDKGNRFAISDSLSRKARISLDQFLSGSKEITQVVKSCWHVGALKGLYHTVLRDEVELAKDADVIISNGDITQGISHNYEYNGELLMIANGVDKQESMAAQMQVDIIMRIFKNQYKRLGMSNRCSREILEKCLITFGYGYGNHDEPRFSGSKNAIPLMSFDDKVRSMLTLQVMHFLEKRKCKGTNIQLVERLVNEKVVRIGESHVMKTKGVAIGVKHPFQNRTKSMSIRSQETVDFFNESMGDWPDRSLRVIPIVDNANFHVAGSFIVNKSGKATFVVMTGAQLHDSSFESNQNKVVDHGLAKNTVCLNDSGQILSAKVEYSMGIAKEDQEIVYADKLTNHDIAKLCEKLSKRFDVAWR